MTETRSKSILSAENHIRQLIEHINSNQNHVKYVENFSLEDFTLRLENSVQDVAKSTTQLAMAFTTTPLPNPKESQEMLNGIEGAADSLVSVYDSLPREIGQHFHNDICKTVKAILRYLLELVETLDMKETKSSRDRLKAAAIVFSACEDIRRLPKNNLISVLNLLNREGLALLDALQEIDEELKNDLSIQKFGEEIDNSEMWNNQDRELLPPCISLVKTARRTVKKITSAVKANADCETLLNISELDNVASVVKHLSPSVDDFVAAIYPPMNREMVKRAAWEVINVIEKLLKQVQKCHFVTQEDIKWINLFLNAVDHNNNKLQPLFSQSDINDCEEI